ncbi:Sel1 repeat-containing protein [Tamilnaduibacter salinus]|uniref:Sel1 repeat-containing protein n=1 Tax=Tamilnaduibacter salinus TaxID=1484056 RepID=A0A2U1CWS1_9GAMM|nr:trypsin-like peptidase domain-containing protein [Tamilnaduibacter salinus]PVY76430.1 Sel1 repeat-containing protein [Tamilnaduibacter salinus]
MHTLKSFIIGALLLVVSLSNGVAAERCGGTHVTRTGETIYDIANTYYGDGRKWTLIYYANRDALRSNPSDIPRGTRLRIPCLESSEADERTLQKDDADLKLLTGGNYEPFTGQSLPGGGLITELVNASFENSPSPVPFSLTWEDDWSKHLFPLLDKKAYDVGFPWLQPNCEENRSNERCRNFHFSEPLFEMLVLLFTRKNAGFEYREDADLHGKTLCRPKGYYDHDLDRRGRRWLSQGHVKLVRGESLDDCFQRLVRGQIDGVTVNEFTGRLTIKEQGLESQVKAMERPISIEGLHVVVSKTHARGTAFMYRFNAGLARLKESERYETILSRHMDNFWRYIEADTEGAPKSKPKPEPEPPPKPAPKPEPKPPASAQSACKAQAMAIHLLLKEDAPRKAVPLLRQAVAAELPTSEYLLGFLTTIGKGITRDPARGVELYKKAAADGHAMAAFKLGFAYYQGKGVEKSGAESVYWFLAADKLSTSGNNRMGSLTDKQNKVLQNLMTTIREEYPANRRKAHGTRFDAWRQNNQSRYPDCKATAGSPRPKADEGDPSLAGTGTGFFVSDRGHVLTNHHVVDECERLEIRTLGNPIADARLVNVSKKDDLALLKTTDFDVPMVARFRTHSDPRLGDPVYIFGFPLSHTLTKSGNLTNGIISGLEGMGGLSTHYQTTAPIQPGNSGGPVVDKDGNVVAVVVSTVNQEYFRTKFKTDVQNANFVIKGHVARGFLRANGVDVLTSRESDAAGNGPRIVRKIATHVRCYK